MREKFTNSLLVNLYNLANLDGIKSHCGMMRGEGGGALFAKDLRGDDMTMNDTLKTIFSRKSVRSFKNEPVPKEKIEMLVRAGMAAPTAVDKRPWEFIVVTDRSILKQLADALPYAKMTEQAAAAIIVGGDISRQWGGTGAEFWKLEDGLQRGV